MTLASVFPALKFGDWNGAGPLAGINAEEARSAIWHHSANGTNGWGTIFQITPGDNFATLFSFNNTNGAQPQAPLLVGADGYLYGTTYVGGTSNYGTVFKFNPTNSLVTTLYSFTNGIDGANPAGALVEVSNGVFYGTTASVNGGVYQITSGGSVQRPCQLNRHKRVFFPRGISQRNGR